MEINLTMIAIKYHTACQYPIIYINMLLDINIMHAVHPTILLYSFIIIIIAIISLILVTAVDVVVDMNNTTQKAHDRLVCTLYTSYALLIG